MGLGMVTKVIPSASIKKKSENQKIDRNSQSYNKKKQGEGEGREAEKNLSSNMQRGKAKKKIIEKKVKISVRNS